MDKNKLNEEKGAEIIKIFSLNKNVLNFVDRKYKGCGKLVIVRVPLHPEIKSKRLETNEALYLRTSVIPCHKCMWSYLRNSLHELQNPCPIILLNLFLCLFIFGVV